MPLPPDEDHQPTIELVRGAVAGRRHELAELCQRVAPAVLAWTHMRMRPAMRARIDPGDIVQEVWVRVLAHLNELDPEAVAFRPWLIGIARNVLFEYSRKAHDVREGAGPTSERWESFLGTVPEEVTGVSGRVARGDLLETFLARVEEIGEIERQILLLHGLEGKDLGEVAKEVGLEREATTKRWQRLRARLLETGPPPYLL